MKFGSVLSPQVKQTLEMCEFEVYVAYKLLATHVDSDIDPTHNKDWCDARTKKELAWMQEAIHAVMSLKEERDLPKKSSAGVTKEEIAYLKSLLEKPYGWNDWMDGWSASADVRASLVTKKLVKIRHNRACGMGDVDSKTCTITARGRAILKKIK